MNTAQQAIARFTGVAGAIAEKDQQLVEQESVLDQVLEAMESVSGQYALLERQLDELQYIDLYEGPESKSQIISDEKRIAVLTRIRRLRHENPIAKRAILLHLYFVLGQGISYLIQDEQLSKNFKEFWADEENQAVFTGHKAMVQRLDEVRTDGEGFLALFVAQAAPYVKLARVPLEEIVEILYDPQNDEIPVWYKRKWYEREYDASLNGGDGGWKPLPPKPKVRYYRDWRITDERLTEIEAKGLSIPEDKQAKDDNERPVYMKHRFVNPVRMKSGVRGMSDLFAPRDWIYGHKKFNEDRLAINAAAAALSIHRKVKGGPAKVRALANTLGGLAVTPEAGTQSALLASRYTRPAAGSILTTTDAEDLKGIKVDTGAPNAALDRDALVSTIGAGVGHPSHYLLGGGNAALAGVQSIEIATMKGYEDGQTWAKTDLLELAKFVFRQIRGEGSDIEEAGEDGEMIAFELPPIEGKDIVKHITANAQFAQQIAPENRVARKIAIKNGLIALKVPNVEQVMKEIEVDEERVNEVKDQQRALQQEALRNGPAGGPPGANGNGRNGNGKGEGQRATDGTHVLASGPDDVRSARLKPPRETTTGPRSKRQ